MKTAQMVLFIVVLAGVSAQQALAGPLSAISVDIPEPTDLALFLIGIAGLLIGRRSSIARGRRDPDQDA